jgi:hypothetical protein
MKNTKPQPPSSRETSSSKRVLFFEFENWSFSGAWRLEFDVFFA